MIKLYEEKKDMIFPLVGMFLIELMVLITLNFANLNWLFRLLAFALMLFILPTFFQKYDKKTLSVLAIALAALLLFVISSAFGSLTSSLLGTKDKLGILLGVIPFFAFGVFLGMQDNSNKTMLRVTLAIYSALALLVLISLILTIYHYGTPWYYLIYSKQDVYKTTIRYAYILVGFSECIVRIESLANLGLVLVTALTYAFLKGKSGSKLNYYFSIGIGMIGVVTIFLLGTPIAIYLLITYLLVMLAIKKWQSKTFKKGLFFGIIAGVIAILVILRLFYQYNVFDIARIIDMTSFLKEMIVPRIDLSSRLNLIIDSFKNMTLLGNKEFVISGFALIDILYVDGVLAMLGFLAFLGVTIYALIRSIKDGFKENATPIFILACIVIIYMFNNYLPLSVYDLRPSLKKYYYPFSLDLLLPILLLYTGYLLALKPKEKCASCA